MKAIKFSILFCICLVIYFYPGNILAQDSLQVAQKTILLENLGIQSSSNLYFSYLSLLYLDKSIKGDENPADLKSVVNGIKNINSVINDSYIKLLNSNVLETTDSLFISKAQEIIEDLKISSDYLLKYVETKEDKDHNKFIKKLNDAWEKLRTVFENTSKK